MDLKTRYLGMKLNNPVVPSASPMTGDLDTLRRLEDAGAGAVVLPSLFEEQILAAQHELNHHLTHGTESFGEAMSYFPDQEEYRLGPENYLENLRRAREALDIPVLGSLNGVSRGGWTSYAKKMEEAGAHGLELNLYFIPTDADFGGRDVEQMYVDTITSVKESVSIPVAMKISPFFSNMAEMAKRFVEAGADGLVLFNRFYQPDLDLENLVVRPKISLSTEFDMRLPLRWIAILHGRVEASLAATRGIRDGMGVLRMLMAGADVTQVASVLFKKGPEAITAILDEMKAWMEKKEYESVEQLKGSMSQKSVTEPAAYERALYIEALQSFKTHSG